MPSDQAEAARKKSAEVMAALKKGDAGDADAIMGKRESKGTQGIVPLAWFGKKLRGIGKSEKGGKEDQVVR